MFNQLSGILCSSIFPNIFLDAIPWQAEASGQPGKADSRQLSLNNFWNLHTSLNPNTGDGKWKANKHGRWCKIFSLWGIFLSFSRPHNVSEVETRGNPKAEKSPADDSTDGETKFLQTFFSSSSRLAQTAEDKN